MGDNVMSVGGVAEQWDFHCSLGSNPYDSCASLYIIFML